MVTWIVYGAAALAGLAVLAAALLVIVDAGGAAQSLTRQAAAYGSSRGLFFRGEYSTGLVRVGAVGVAAIGLTGPAHLLEAVGVPFVGGAPFILYLVMVAAVFVVAGIIRIRSRFRAMVPPITVPLLVGGILILVLCDNALEALPTQH